MKKVPSATSRQWQELTLRNQKLALEVARLQNLNRILRNKIHELNRTQLRIGKVQVEHATQTDTDVLSEPQKTQYQKDVGNWAETEDNIALIQSPAPQRRDRVSTGTSRKSHRRSGAIASDISEHFLGPSPKTKESSLRTILLSPHSGGRQQETAPTVKILSPCQERVYMELATKACSPAVASSESVAAFSPERTLPRRNSTSSARDSDASELRTPRSTKKPVSYQEPSLRVKVRKGFKFFQFS